MNAEQQAEHRRGQRAAEAERIEAEIEDLDCRRKQLRETLRRLTAPVDVDGLVRRAEAGVDLTQAELAELAVERPDVFNETFERSRR